MSELEERISGILNDPNQMEKIAQMAKSLMNGGLSANDKLGASLGDLFGGGSGGSGTNTATGSNSGFGANSGEGSGMDNMLDPETIMRLGKIMSGIEGVSGKNRALLDAMRPYLSEKRREKLDRAVRLARMAKLAEVAFREFGGDLK